MDSGQDFILTKRNWNTVIRICLLGKLEVTVAGVLLIPRGKSGLWLLGLLALHANRPVERDWLAGTLWPDSAPEQGRENLRRALTDIRRALGATASCLSNPSKQTIALQVAESEVDVLAFRAGNLKCYTGSLMPDCALEWVISERRVLEETYLTLGEQQTALLAPDAALILLESLRACSPLRESLLRLQLSTLCQLGNRAEAQQVYYHFRRLLLEKRLGEPSAQTQEHWKNLQNREDLAELSVSATIAAPDSLPSAHTASLGNPDPFVYLPNNLPQQLTSFVGREKQIADVNALLVRTRLLTLTGVGGSGKTRLALRIAADHLGAFHDGVWLVELAPLSEPNMVARTVAQSVGVKEAVGQTIIQTLTQQLKTKNVFLVLDNCEHLLNACAELAAVILRACPNVVVLATSRESLGIAGETTYRVPALTLPCATQIKNATAENLFQFEAVRLFVDRAQLVKTDFTVTNINAPALAQICHRLDGIPLALELAATRVRSLTVGQINDKLDSRFRILTGNDKSVLARHQTLRALVDWSYDLLSIPEKNLLARLSVFVGGWTLEAAESVCGFEPVEKWEVLDLLTSLVDKSLILAEEQAKIGTTRYRMLETIRQYARDRLLETGDGASFRNKHLDYFSEFAEKCGFSPTVPHTKTALCRLEAEVDNMRAGLDWGGNAPEHAEKNLRIALALYELMGRISTREIQERLSSAMEYAGNADIRLRAERLHNLGNTETILHEFTAARQYYEAALALWQELGNRSRTALTINNLGILAMYQKDYVSARQRYETALAMQREMGNQYLIAAALCNLGATNYYQGDFVSARPLLEESTQILRVLVGHPALSVPLGFMGYLDFAVNDFRSAGTTWREGLSLSVEQERYNIPELLNGLGGLLAVNGAPPDAARLWGALDRLLEAAGQPLPIHELEWQNAQVRAARAALGDDIAFDAAWQEGRALSLEQAVALAMRDTTESPNEVV